MLSTLELKLTQQIEQILERENSRISDLEARVALLEQERAAMTAMLSFFDTLQTAKASSDR